MQKSRLIIVLEGGMVQSVVSDQPENFGDVEIMTLDYDTDGASDGTTIKVPDGRGGFDHACLGGYDIEPIAPDVLRTIKKASRNA